MLDWLFGGGASPTKERTHALLEQVIDLRRQSHFQDEDAVNDFIADILIAASEQADVSVGQVLGKPLYRLLHDMLHQEPFLVDVQTLKPLNDSLQAGVDFREHLARIVDVLTNESERLAAWKNTMTLFLGRLFEYFPAVAFADPLLDGSEESVSPLSGTVPLYELIDECRVAIEIVAVTMASPRDNEKGLYAPTIQQLTQNLCRLGDMTEEEFHYGNKRPPYPTEMTKTPLADVVQGFLGGMAFEDLFHTPITISVPEATRYEHCHILAGTGHGKTQTLQYLIANDLLRGLDEPLSVVVIDPHGDMIQTLAHSSFFNPNRYGRKTIIIDPTDVLFPPRFNLFDAGGTDSNVDARTRETIQNNTLDFFEYFFSALIGSELTGKQTTLFRYIGILLMQVPNANIHTIIDLMQRGERYKPYIAKLSGSSKLFFETRFFDPSFRETKKQIAVRLFGVLSSQTLDRMFAAKKNKINFYEALQNGSIILVNAAQDFLGAEASKIFIRLMVSLLGQALIRRAAIAPDKRTPTYLYIDEAGNVVDETLVALLSQIRKYKGAITFSHQYLDQLPSDIRAGVIAGTAIKLAGGISHKDANTLAPEFRCDASYLQGMQKRRNSTAFALYARNVTAQPLRFEVPFGQLEEVNKLSDKDYDALIEHSRGLYGAFDVDDAPDLATESGTPDSPAQAKAQEAPPSVQTLPKDSNANLTAREPTYYVPPSPVVVSPEPPPVTSFTPSPEVKPIRPVPTSTPEPDVHPSKPPTVESEIQPAIDADIEVVAVPVYRKEGGGGVKHQYVQQLAKDLGEQSGWRVTLEETVLEGTGRIDAVARRGDDRILVEVSVTTTREHEYANILKCLEYCGTLDSTSGNTHVLLVASHARHLTGLRRYIEPQLSPAEKALVRFMLPDDLPPFFDALAVHAPTEAKVVKGYKVKSKVLASSPDEAIARRRAVAQVIANSEFKNEVNSHL